MSSRATCSTCQRTGRCGNTHREAEISGGRDGSFFKDMCVCVCMCIITVNVFKITTNKKRFLVEAAVLTLTDDCFRL